MDFAPRMQRQRPTENIVPMINIVFLLLIFFLISAQIAPPDPVQVQLPEGLGEAEHPQDDTLYIDADGTLYFGQTVGDAALDLLGQSAGDAPLYIRADAALPANVLAALLPKLAAAGVAETRLMIGGQ